MIKISSAKGRRLALFGLGGSGLAAARACMAGGADVTVWDDREEAVQRARGLGLKTQDLRELDWKKISALILSPGVPLTYPEPHWSAALARRNRVEIIGDIELFARERRAFLEAHKLDRRHLPFIAVTGTNGKSTVTALIAHMLHKAGWDAQAGGNIGRPILDLEEFRTDARQVYIIECSSYQIDLTPSLAPTIGILLNITPDHIDRHGSFDNYAAVKARLAEKSETAIVAYDDAATLAIYQKLEKERRSNAYYARDQGRPRLIGVGAPQAEDGRSIPQDCVTAPAGFTYRVGHFYEGDKLLISSAALRGRHNGQNGICALAACAALGAEGFEAGLKDFKGLPHRMEEVGQEKYKGVTIRFVNDSKATNAEAAAPALLSYRNIYWLAGGQAKAGGINMLLNQKYLAQIRRAYFFGAAAADFAKSWAETHFTAAGKTQPIASLCPYEARETMAEALAAAERAVKADIDAGKIAKGSEAAVLLAPACASFDQFRSFEHRGREFAERAAERCAAALLNAERIKQ